MEMNIEILDMPTPELSKKIHSIYKLKETTENVKLKSSSINIIKNIISDRQISEMFTELQSPEFVTTIGYKGLAKIEEAARILSENITELKTQVELDDFFSHGYNIDTKKLRQQYRNKGLHKDFPNLNFNMIKELYVNPPKEIPVVYNQTMKIAADPFVFRKYMIAINQMIFNHMDIVICNIGDEGAGKSCKCSQDMYIIWWIMTQIGLIDYEFDINEMFANTLRRFSELEDKYYGVPFRIIGLDEGNELNRQDWKEDDVKLFWQRLRRERHERRIKFINIPVLGEMIINIVVSRINFIFDMKQKNEEKTGTLYKGTYDFYIVPRGSKIYSPYLNRELTKEEVKNKLYLNLKDKEYLKGLPKDIKIKRCYCNGVWAFREVDYIKKMKETNMQYTIEKGMRFGLSELFAFYNAKPSAKILGINKDDATYHSLRKMIVKIKHFWNADPELLTKYEKIFQYKQEQRERDTNIKKMRKEAEAEDKKEEDEKKRMINGLKNGRKTTKPTEEDPLFVADSAS